MEAWPNSCPVTPAVMCNSLKCGQQMTLSRTVADYTTTLDKSCVWITGTVLSGKQLNFWGLYDSLKSCHFNMMNTVMPGWIGILLAVHHTVWMYNCRTVCPNRWLSSPGVTAKHSPLFWPMLGKPLHYRQPVLCSQWQFINNATDC